MPIEVLSAPPGIAVGQEAPSSAADASSANVPAAVHHHEPAGVQIQLSPDYAELGGTLDNCSLSINEASLTFFSGKQKRGLSIPYSHISIHAKAKAPRPSGPATDEPQPCVYCQVEEQDPDAQPDDAGESPVSHEMWIWPSNSADVDAIFAALSHCASLNPHFDDESPAFVSESDYAAHGEASTSDSRAAQFAAMGLDPGSLVYATQDGGVAGPGLEAAEADENGQWDDVEEEQEEQADPGADCAVADDDDEDDDDGDPRTMQEVIPGLWIGEYQAALDRDLLQKRKIACVVSAMRQEYDAAPGVTDTHRVAVDDTDKANIIEHFIPTADFISSALERNDGGVLVHCQAGVSRSTTLVAAYLMARHGMNAEQAIDRIRAARPQVDPSEFFRTQLDMFERCHCEWDPVRYPEERRFLMSFAHAQILEGASPSIVLAYYPSPATTPKDRAGSFGFSMTSLPRAQISPPTSPNQLQPRQNPLGEGSGEATVVSAGTAGAPAEDRFLPMTYPKLRMEAPPLRKRMTPRKTDSSENITQKQQADKAAKAEVAKIGSPGEVVISGRRLLCKICRRELAAREHIVAHDVGKGQQAFAPNRRDMAAFRAEQERLRREGGAGPATAKPLAAASAGPAAPAGSNPLAALRVAQPMGGGRIVQPRPSNVPKPQPVARPSARQAQPAAAEQESTATAPEAGERQEATGAVAEDDGVVQEDAGASDAATTLTANAEAAIEGFAPPSEPEPPLLPSPACSSYFVEPLSWMGPVLETGVLAGKIVCPGKRCGAKLGSFDWAGNQCSCGAWVCPGFALNVSRVDEVAGV